MILPDTLFRRALAHISTSKLLKIKRIASAYFPKCLIIPLRNLKMLCIKYNVAQCLKMLCIFYSHIKAKYYNPFLQLKELWTVLVYSDLCTPLLKAIFKADAVTACLKCIELSSSQEIPSQSIFVLTALLEASPRWAGVLRALPWSGSVVPPGNPLRCTVQDYSSIFEPGLNYWESGRVDLNRTRAGRLTPLQFFFFLSCQSRNKCLESNGMRISFYFLLDRLDLLWLLSEIGFGTANSCNLGLAKGIMGLF